MKDLVERYKETKNLIRDLTQCGFSIHFLNDEI